MKFVIEHLSKNFEKKEVLSVLGCSIENLLILFFSEIFLLLLENLLLIGIKARIF